MAIVLVDYCYDGKVYTVKYDNVAKSVVFTDDIPAFSSGCLPVSDGDTVYTDRAYQVLARPSLLV